MYICDGHTWCMLIKDSESRLDLVPIYKGADGPLQYDYNLAKSIRFPGGHGEEIVRDLFTDAHVSVHICYSR